MLPSVHSEFVEEDGDWVEYMERLEHFFLANDIRRGKAVVNSPECVRGQEVQAYPEYCHAKESGRDRLQRAGNDGASPQPQAVIVQRFKFHTHSRKPGITVAAFVVELRQLSEH